jgi:outer membrane protein
MKQTIFPARALACIAVCATASGAMAQSAPPAQPLWELGVAAAAVSQQAYPGSDHQVRRALALPYVIYRGSIFRADQDGVQVRALKSGPFELDVGVHGTLGSNSSDIEARRGMPDLGTLVEAGPRIKWKIGAAPGGGRWEAELPLRGVFDLSDGLAAKGMTFEPELRYARRSESGWAYNTKVGLRYGNRKINETLYGVTAAQATAIRPAYTARAGLVDTYVGLTASRKMSDDWRFVTSLRVDTVSGAANASSPLVRQKTGSTLWVGVVYTGWRSSQTGTE